MRSSSLEALRAGASGYLMKSSDVSELVIAIQTVHRGNTYYSSAIGRWFRPRRDQLPVEAARTKRASTTLTRREREVLQLIAEGHTNQRVADELVISVKTVEAHKAHIMTKLHAGNRTDLIRYALSKGIVHLESVAEAEKMLVELDVPTTE